MFSRTSFTSAVTEIRALLGDADPASAGLDDPTRAWLLQTRQAITAQRRALGRGRTGGGMPHRARGPRRGVLAAVGALATAGLAGALIAAPFAGTGPASPGHATTTLTAATFLNEAAAAALHEPVRKPRPDQFVHYKSFGSSSSVRQGRATETDETWASVSGTHPGLWVTSVKNGTGPVKSLRVPLDWCAHGYLHPLSVGKVAGRKLIRVPCSAREYAGYLPYLPATTAGMRAFLQRQLRLSDNNPEKLIDGRSTVSLLTGGYYILTHYYLTTAQQAAMYHAMATTPGLTVVPKVTNALGEVGVGIRYYSSAKRITWTAIFDPTTFQPLGSTGDWMGTKGSSAVIVPPTIVNKVGERP
jgi:hypothetical protein